MSIQPMVRFPAAIPGQFILLDASDASRLAPHPLRAGWHRTEIQGVCLLSAPGVQIVRCRLTGGQVVGFFIGEPLDLERGVIVGEELRFDDPPAPPYLENWVEDQVYRFGGRYVFVLTLEGAPRVYLDADGFLPVVYDPELRVCGATAGAIFGLDEFIDRFDVDLFNEMRLDSGGWFPAGLTAHRGLRRLMCNFYLDLASWSVHRHWPKSDLPVVADPVEASAQLGAAIRAALKLYVEAAPCCMALTGGYESRLLLALTRDFAKSLQFVCWYNEAGDRDKILSDRIARIFELGLRSVKFPEVTDEEANEWMARTGYCAAENRYRYKAAETIGDFRYLLGGLGGEIGRGFFWRTSDGSTPLTASDIYTRLALRPHPAAEEAVADWFNTLPTREPLLQLDLAYLEVRMSCWAAVQAYAAVGPRVVYPMISRDIYTRMLTLPPECRRQNRWLLHVIRSNWPELLSVPINSLGLVQEALRAVRRAIHQPSLITRRLKRKFC